MGFSTHDLRLIEALCKAAGWTFSHLHAVAFSSEEISQPTLLCCHLFGVFLWDLKNMIVFKKYLYAKYLQIWVVKLDPNALMLTYMKFMNFSIKHGEILIVFNLKLYPYIAHAYCILHLLYVFMWIHLFDPVRIFWWHSKKLPTVPLCAWAKSSKAKVGCWSFERPWSTSFKTWSLETKNP